MATHYSEHITLGRLFLGVFCISESFVLVRSSFQFFIYFLFFCYGLQMVPSILKMLRLTRVSLTVAQSDLFSIEFRKT